MKKIIFKELPIKQDLRMCKNFYNNTGQPNPTDMFSTKEEFNM